MVKDILILLVIFAIFGISGLIWFGIVMTAIVGFAIFKSRSNE